MKKLITICLMLLGVAAQAQNFAITATTVDKVRKNVVKGNSANYGLGMIDDTLMLVGLNSLYRVALGDNNSIQNRTLTLTQGTGVLITGGTQNLTANRTWTISLPQSVSTSASPTFVGINLTGNANLGGNVGITGNLTVTGNSIFNGDIFSNAVLRLVSANNNQYESRIIQTDGSFSISNYYNGIASIPSYENVFNVVGGRVGVNNNAPTTDFHVSGGAKIENNLELNDISDVRAAINSKLNTSTAASTYAPLASPTFTGTTEFTGNVNIGDAYKLAVAGDIEYNNFPATNTIILGNNVGKMTWGQLTNSYVSASANIDASKLGTGVVSTSELNVLDGLTTTTAKLNYLTSATGTTGTGNLVYSGSPTLVTPNLGTPSAVTLTNGTGLPISTGISGLGSGVATFLVTPSSANLLAALTTKTGTGNAVFSDNSTLTGTTNIATIANTLGANFAMSSGNVGIGITPTVKLHVVASAINSDVAIFTGANTNRGLKISTAAATSNDDLVRLNAQTSTGEMSFQLNSVDKVRLNATGLGIGTASPAQLLDVSGIAQATQFKLSTLNTAPTSATATGVLGEIRITSGFIYVCTATNTWVRSALATW